MRPKFLLSAMLTAIVVVPLQVQAMQCPTAKRGNLGAVAEGRRAFLEFNCSGCHGDTAAGGMGPGIKGAEYGDVQEAVLQGDAKEGGMPSFNGCVSVNDVQNIVSYLRAVGTKSAPTWLDWWMTNP